MKRESGFNTAGGSAVWAAAILLAFGLNSATAAQAASRSYLLISQDDNLPAGLESKVQALGGTVTRTIPQVGIAAATTADAQFQAKAGAIAGLRSVVPNPMLQWINPPAHAAQPAGPVPASIGDAEPLFPLQWGLQAINASGAWNAGYKGRGARVAVLDTGFHLTHPDLAPNINFALCANFIPWEELQFHPSPPDPSGPPFPFSHRTHTAGIVAAAANGIGVIGVAPEAELVLVKMMTDAGWGPLDAALAGIVHAADVQADVISMSFSTPPLPRHGLWLGDVWFSARELEEIIQAYSRVTTYAYQKGATLVAAAANYALDFDRTADTIIMPACFPHVIAVSATGPVGWAYDPTTSLDVPAFYTDYGQSVISFAAPGGDIRLLINGDPNGLLDMVIGCNYFDADWPLDQYGWAPAAGTSMATPHVAGVAALIIGKTGGSMSPAQVEAALRHGADDLGKPGNDDWYGAGRVNAAKSVR